MEAIEVWRPLAGEFSGFPYEVSDGGSVRSFHNGRCRVLLPQKNNAGYLQVVICKRPNPPKRVTIHRLVQRAFGGPPESHERTVNHIDGNKRNNSACNLEWSSYSDNLKHAIKTGLRKMPRSLSNDVARLVKHSAEPTRTMARRLGVARNTIRQIRRGNTYQDVA